MVKTCTVPQTLDHSRTEQLQFLRFLGFLNVYICHADKWIFFRYPSSHCAAQAVSFFIMLSGFLTGYNAFGREISLGWKQEAQYLWKKLVKFYPLYFISNAAILLSSGLAGAIAAGNQEAVFNIIRPQIINSLFLQCWIPKLIFGGNPVCWTMATLMFLYLFNLPFTKLLEKINRHPLRYLIFAGMVFFFWGTTVTYCYLYRENMEFWHYVFPPARMGEYFSAMVTGFALHSVRGKLPPVKAAKIGFTILELCAMAFWFLSLYRPGSPWASHIVSWMVPNMVLLLVFTCGLGWISHVFRWKPLVRLGNCSFECYLLHGYFILLFGFLNDIPETSMEAKKFAFLFCLLFTVSMALLLSRYKPVKQGVKG